MPEAEDTDFLRKKIIILILCMKKNKPTGFNMPVWGETTKSDPTRNQRKEPNKTSRHGGAVMVKLRDSVDSSGHGQDAAERENNKMKYRSEKLPKIQHGEEQDALYMKELRRPSKRSAKT